MAGLRFKSKHPAFKIYIVTNPPTPQNLFVIENFSYQLMVNLILSISHYYSLPSPLWEPASKMASNDPPPPDSHTLVWGPPRVLAL